MSIQSNDIMASLQRAPLVQQAHPAPDEAERTTAKQVAADLERLAQAAEEEVATTAPTGGKMVRERDAGQGRDYAAPRRRKAAPPTPPAPPPPTARKRSNPPGHGTLIDIDA